MKQIASIFIGFMAFVSLANAQNILPQANLDITPGVVRIGEILRYDASNSRNGQGTARDLEYRFRFTNNGPWTIFSARATGEFIPKETGHERISVEIRDRNTGAIQRTHRRYEVRQERRPNPPRIRLLSTPPFSAGEQIGFEVIVLAESFINKNDILVRWDFNSDGNFDTPWQTDKRGYFAYPSGNLVSPTVSVQFPGGRTLTVRGIRTSQAPSRGFDFVRDVEKLFIDPVQIQSPVVNVSPGHLAKSTDTTFEFDASQTSLGSNSSLEFFFDGVKTHTGVSKIKHRFTTPGEHQVRVRHCLKNPTQICRTTEIRIMIEDDIATRGLGFEADFTVNEVLDGVDNFQINENVYQAVVSSPLRFTGQVRQLVSGQRPEFEYRWDFDGNGIFDTPFSKKLNGEFTYDEPGDYKAKLEIRDDRGNTMQRTKTIFILKNTRPIGQIRTADWPNYVGQYVQFQLQVADAESSQSQLEARFDFNGDGLWDTDFRNTTSQRWNYDQPGDYQVKVQVRDPQKEVQTITRTIPILKTPAPQLKVQVSHRNQVVGQPVRLDASKTVGEGLSYEWRVLEDPYAPIGRGQISSMRFDTAGDRTICLHIIDQAGNVEQINFPITIVESLPENGPAAKTPPQGGGKLANNPPTIAEAINEFEAPQSDFIWSDAGLINRPGWRLTGMRPGL